MEKNAMYTTIRTWTCGWYCCYEMPLIPTDAFTMLLFTFSEAEPINTNEKSYTLPYELDLYLVLLLREATRSQDYISKWKLLELPKWSSEAHLGKNFIFQRIILPPKACRGSFLASQCLSKVKMHLDIFILFSFIWTDSRHSYSHISLALCSSRDSLFVTSGF